MPIPFEFDFKKPDYLKVFNWRLDKLNKIRDNPALLIDLKEYYKNNPAQFIIDWGTTSDPRNVERNLPALAPFLLFPRQEEWIHWFLDLWKNQKPGITDKSREMGLSWLTIALACTMCLFHDNLVVGFGSRKEEYVDKLGDPKSLLQKARQFISLLPHEFRGDWDIKKHAPHMRIHLPGTNSIISGEAGDGIGRGDRASFYIVDESAWLPRPELVEASLSQTTNCRIDISTPRGMNNPFARRRHGGKVSVFSFHWRDDPRKDEEWYNKKCHDLDDPVVIAQEIDLDYSASLEGVLIPSKWVQASVDAHKKLGIEITGEKVAAFDVADEGRDKNAFCGRHGILVEYLEQWSGKNDDIFKSVEKVFTLCDVLEYNNLSYDADGLGAGVRGDARVINARRAKNNVHQIVFNAFRGSGEVVDKNKDPFLKQGQAKGQGKGRTNQDFFANAKAQAWWHLRRKFQNTYRAVVEKLEYEKDELISLSSTLPDLTKLITELSQPTYSQNTVGKIIIDKTPAGGLSPNLADSVMMIFAPTKKRGGMFYAIS